MELHGPVLCATDLSEAADAALRQGFDIASSIGSQAIACHVLPEAFRVRVLFPQDAGVDSSFETELAGKATNIVRRRLESVVGTTSKSLPIEIETGTAHAGILALAERLGAGLIVVGPGGTALRVARSAAVPVLIARPSPTGGAVLGATDFSDPSLPAVHVAAFVAQRRGVGFRVVHCLDIDETTYVGGAGLPGAFAPWPLPQDVVDQLTAAARDRLTSALADLRVPADAEVLRRSAVAGILEAAQSTATSLIVVGTRGRTGLARLALGSVAEGVIGHAPCSVLVVPLHPA